MEAETEQRSLIHRARQSIIIESMRRSGCCSSTCVQCLGLAGACAACSQHAALHDHGMLGVVLGLDHSQSLTRRSLSVSRALHACSAHAFCARRRLPLICLKLLVGVCIRDGLAASVCEWHSVLLLPLSFFLGVGASRTQLAPHAQRRRVLKTKSG